MSFEGPIALQGPAPHKKSDFHYGTPLNSVLENLIMNSLFKIYLRIQYNYALQ